MLKLPHSPRVALLVDADNAHLEHTPNIIAVSLSYGSLTIRQAYGDWKQPPLSSWRKKMRVFGIVLVQMKRIGKNATDRCLIEQADELLKSGKVDIFIIVSGDRHFKGLCERIRQQGKQAIGIGSRTNTAKALEDSCDDFIYFEDLESILRSLDTSHPFPVRLLNTFNKLVDMAFLQLPQKDGWVHGGPLGTKLRELDAKFEERFGSKKLSTWLRGLEDRFESHEQFVRRINR